jgi:Linalool dehydratase/isomerase
MSATVMELSTQHSALSTEGAGYLRYLHSVLTRPLEDWSSFYTPRSANANFALRYQIAFASYALAALATLTPAYHRPYADALRAAIARMIDYATWRYWELTPGVPHNPTQQGYSPDPLAWGNVQYAGHLSTMLGLYAKLTGDHRYADEGFVLEGGGHRFSHTYHDVAATIHQQMADNQCHGVSCEPGCVYLSCNNHSMSSNLLHDQLYASDYAAVNAEWVAWLKQHMLAGMFPTLKHGLFNVVYMSEMKHALPVSFNFTDGWGIGLLAPFARSLATELYPRYRREVRRVKPKLAYVPSGPMTERMEVSDRPLNTAFGYVAARELGDPATADAIHNYAVARLGLGERDGQLACWDAARTLYVTALFALGSVDAAPGAGWSAIVLAPHQPASFSEPALDAVLLDGEVCTALDVDVTAAQYDAADRTLRLTVTPRRSGQLALRLANVAAISAAQIDGQPAELELADGCVSLGAVAGGNSLALMLWCQ